MTDTEWPVNHYPVDFGFCSCGLLIETGTRFRKHIEDVNKLERTKAEPAPAELFAEILAEIARGNLKHGHGELATPIQVVSILVEELGEFAQALMQRRVDHARKELLQVAAVAINHLLGTGPHFSEK